MKKLLLLIALVGFSSTALSQVDTLNHPASVLQIHIGPYAFCGASGAVPTGRTMMVEGKEFQEACAICPVMDGPSINNLAITGFSPQSPDGTDSTVWSLFWYFDPATDSVPQFDPQTKTWELLTPVNRAFTVDTDHPSTSMSNMFCMPCKIWKEENDILLAKCYGPINEAAVPLRVAIPVVSGMTSITQAKEGFPYPVGTPIPSSDVEIEGCPCPFTDPCICP
jgi:hypothetical protein